MNYANLQIEGVSIPDDVRNRLKLLLTTAIGTVVLDREFGIDMSFIDKPVIIAKRLYTIEVVKKIKKYEPEIKINSIKFKTDKTNLTKLIPILNVTYIELNN